jgi:hypothetical protein
MGNLHSSNKNKKLKQKEEELEMLPQTNSSKADKLYYDYTNNSTYRKLVENNKTTILDIFFLKIVDYVLSGNEINATLQESLYEKGEMWRNGQLAPSAFVSYVLTGGLGDKVQQLWSGKEDELMQFILKTLELSSGGKCRKGTRNNRKNQGRGTRRRGRR